MNNILEFVKQNKLAFLSGVLILSLYGTYQAQGWVCMSCASEEKFVPGTRNQHK